MSGFKENIFLIGRVALPGECLGIVMDQAQVTNESQGNGVWNARIEHLRCKKIEAAITVPLKQKSNKDCDDGYCKKCAYMESL